jgi:hypothetical protein
MLDPRIVAASTQVFEDSRGPEATDTDVSTSLHGMGPQFTDHPPVRLQNLLDKLYRRRPSPTADATLFTRSALASPNAKTPGRLRTYELKIDALSLFFSESRRYIRSVEMERDGLFLQLTESAAKSLYPTCS